MTIPRDLVDEIRREVADSCRALAREADRLERLVELDRLVLDVALRLGRPPSVLELFEEADRGNADRLGILLRALRTRSLE